MATIHYLRVSGRDQSVEAQQSVLGGEADQTFIDEGVSGAIRAMERPGFRAMMSYVREGDLIRLYAVDRLGRDAIDVQSTVRTLMDKGVTLDVRGIGVIGKGVGELVIAVLAQIAEMERDRIADRCASGRQVAIESLRTTGRTHRGALGMGRPRAADADLVREWRKSNHASVSETAINFGISTATVKRYCRTS